jgi:hypothetical protein
MHASLTFAVFLHSRVLLCIPSPLLFCAVAAGDQQVVRIQGQ